MRSYALLYDGSCGFCRWIVRLLSHLSMRSLVVMVDVTQPRALAQYPQVPPSLALQSVHLVTPTGRALRGYDAIVELVRLIPVVRWMVPLMELEWIRHIGWAVYEWVTAHRHEISRVLRLE